MVEDKNKIILFPIVVKEKKDEIKLIEVVKLLKEVLYDKKLESKR